MSDHRHHAPGNDARRRGRGRESEGPALRAAHRQARRPSAARELPREQKLIPIIGDEHVDFEFGTGVLKVTPAHDKADFEIGQRHKLPLDRRHEPERHDERRWPGEDLHGLDRFEARKVAVELLRSWALLVKEEPYENNVGFSQRADVPIEPRLSEQWFLKYPSVRERATASRRCEARAARIRIRIADALERRAYVRTGCDNTAQDWCISRQLWWGHRMPVWTMKHDNSRTAATAS